MRYRALLLTLLWLPGQLPGAGGAYGVDGC